MTLFALAKGNTVTLDITGTWRQASIAQQVGKALALWVHHLHPKLLSDMHFIEPLNYIRKMNVNYPLLYCTPFSLDC